ncbi:MAG: hypothetical protein IPJ82_08140 [Lewinellaceae bacterium]|nr:hypothetical protein [Lewinellaceae bacterium]
MEENEVVKPKNGWELLRWVVYEPYLLQEYSDSVKDWKMRLRVMLKPMGWIVLISVAVYLLSGMVIAGFDWPAHFPEQFKPGLLEVWHGSFWEKWQAYFALTFKKYL